jgi:hypothetical protein
LSLRRYGFAASLLPVVLVLDGCRGDAPTGIPDAGSGGDASIGVTSDGGAADNGGSSSGGASTSSGGASNGGASSGGTASGGASPSGGTTSVGDGGADAGGTTGVSGAGGGNGGSAGTCVSQTPCTPAECQNGATVCDGSGKSTCMHNGDVTDGTPCNMNMGVCSKGVCNPCSTGADCTPSGSCQKMTIVCSSGAPVCTAAGNVTNGSPCGTNLYCNNGACAQCTPNASCVPDGKPCNNGIVSCSMGKVVCTDQGTPAMNGTSCGTNQVCNGGACKPCTANTVCTPTNACHVGHTTCDTGVSVCTDTNQAQQNNTQCTGTNKCNASYTCQSGTCTGAAPISCTAFDSCHQVGTCDQTTGVCSNPNQPDTTPCGTANMACTSGKCQCASGYNSCNGACVDLQSDKANCGVCSHDCIGGKCSGGVCQKWLVGTDSGGPSTRIAADGTSVAWSDGAGLWLIPAAGVDNGKTARNLSTTFVPAMTFSNGRLIWISDVLQQPQTTLSVVTASGGNVATSAAQNTGGSSFSVITDASGNNVFFMDAANNNPSFGAYSCSPISAGAACTKVNMGTGQPISSFLGLGLPIGTYVISSSNADFYFGAPSAVSRISLYGAAGATTAANVVQAMTADSTGVFWMDAVVNSSDGTESFTVKKAPLTLASSSTVVSSQSGLSIGSYMTTDSTNVYFTNSQSASFSISPPSYIAYAPKAGGASKILVNSSNVIMGVVAAGGAIYWIEIVYNVATPSTSVYGQRFP